MREEVLFFSGSVRQLAAGEEGGDFVVDGGVEGEDVEGRGTIWPNGNYL